MCASSAGTRSSPRVPHGPIAVQGRNQSLGEQNSQRDGPRAIRRAKGGSHPPCKAKPLLLSLSRARVTLRLLRTLTYARSSVCAVATQRLHSRAVGVDSGAGAITPIPQRRRGGTEWSASPVRPPTTVLTWCARPTQWYSANLPSGSCVPRSRRDTARHSLSGSLAHGRAHGRRILDWPSRSCAGPIADEPLHRQSHYHPHPPPAVPHKRAKPRQKAGLTGSP